jgi:hypothetical protein
MVVHVFVIGLWRSPGGHLIRERASGVWIQENRPSVWRRAPLSRCFAMTPPTEQNTAIRVPFSCWRTRLSGPGDARYARKPYLLCARPDRHRAGRGAVGIRRRRRHRHERSSPPHLAGRGHRHRGRCVRPYSQSLARAAALLPSPFREKAATIGRPEGCPSFWTGYGSAGCGDRGSAARAPRAKTSPALLQ